MDSQFIVYLKLGFEHISDIKGYDHILFIVTLCAIYSYQEWKKVAILVTAFTIGHSVTLAMAALKIIIVNAYLVELLIPITILTTAILNIAQVRKQNSRPYLSYILALCFGFIHGMGFSNFFVAIMGDSMSIVEPLFAFNIGLEIGQLLIVCLFLGLYWGISKLWVVPQKYWTWACSGFGAVLALNMIIERI
jgi:hypothetical protein